LEASLQYSISLTSIQVSNKKSKKKKSLRKILFILSEQRSTMLSSLVSSLQVLSNSTNATVYLGFLNKTVLQSIYPLFIEAEWVNCAKLFFYFLNKIYWYLI